MNYYPKNLKVRETGTLETISFLQNTYKRDDVFLYAELGVYQGSTVISILNNFPNCKIHLFDFEDTIVDLKKKFILYEERITYFSNSYKFCDSYNYNLIKLIDSNTIPIYDYVFLDGAHTVAIDALAYFLIDILLKDGGFLDFDDYNWRLAGSSLDPRLVKETSLCYTDEQINNFEVKTIVDVLVKKNKNFKEIVKNKIFQKNQHSFN